MTVGVLFRTAFDGMLCDGTRGCRSRTMMPGSYARAHYSAAAGRRGDPKSGQPADLVKSGHG